MKKYIQKRMKDFIFNQFFVMKKTGEKPYRKCERHSYHSHSLSLSVYIVRNKTIKTNCSASVCVEIYC